MVSCEKEFFESQQQTITLHLEICNTTSLLVRIYDIIGWNILTGYYNSAVNHE